MKFNLICTDRYYQWNNQIINPEKRIFKILLICLKFKSEIKTNKKIRKFLISSIGRKKFKRKTKKERTQTPIIG